jgi:hypothetical protein
MSTALGPTLGPTLRLFARTAALALVVVAANPAQAGGSAQGGWRGGHQQHGHGHRGWGWGLLPWVLAPLFLPQQVLVVQTPAPVLVDAPPPPAPVATAPSRPDPVIYPRNGQSAQQLEADRQDCNRWATTQPQALADSSVFMRAADACMDGRGYTTK